MDIEMTIGAAGKIRFAMRKNSRVAYRANGIATDAPVLFLHDLLFTHSVFVGLPSSGLLADLRGHGASATLANQWFSMAELAEDVAAILDAEKASFAHLAGHGLGGAIAFAFAQKYPDRVQSLTLIEPNISAVLDKDLDRGARALRDERRTADRAAGDAAYKELTDIALDRYLTPRFGPDWRTRASKARAAAIRRNAGALSGMLPALDAFTPGRADIQRMTIATLLLAGRDAAPVDQLSLARLAADLPNARTASLAFHDRLNDPFAADAGLALAELLQDFVKSR
jgi:pimeloyl-ACP methyl ester carboxylesterase